MLIALRGRRRAPAGALPAAPLAEAAVTVAVAVGAGFLAQAAVAASGFSARAYAAQGLGPVWAAIMLALALAGYAVQHRLAGRPAGRLAVAALAGAAVGLVVVPMVAGLNGTDQPLLGVLKGDMTFRTEDVTRFASTWHLSDYTFRGLHAFYPPAWFWLAGRTAHALGMVPWHVVKPFTIATVGAALLLSFLLWRGVLSPAGALAAAIGSSLVLPAQIGLGRLATQGWYSAYSTFVAIAGPAWLAAAFGAARRPGWARLALLALAGALLALTYDLLFVLLAVVLLAVVLLTREERGRALRRSLALLVAIAALTAVFWVPLAGAVLGGGMSQGHYVMKSFNQVFVGFDGPAALAVLAAVAFVGLFRVRHTVAGRALLAVILGTILYQLLSVLSLVAAHSQLQPHRAVTMMWSAFGAAAAVVLDARLRGTPLVRPATLPLGRLAAGACAVLALPAVFVLGAGQGANQAGGPYARAAHSPQRYPRANAISHYIARATGRPPDRDVVLSDYPGVTVLHPYYGFVALKARYAHPAGHERARVRVIEAAAACPDPACTLRDLTRSRFGPVDALVLQRSPLGYAVAAQYDGFPRPVTRVVIFPGRELPRSLWTQRRFGGYEVFVPRHRA